MPSIEQNQAIWTRYDWPQQGEEWSAAWGCVEMQWRGSLWPRLAAFLPAASILEIAPGYGRFTHYLKDLCRQLTVVDLTARSIEACQQRFAGSDHITYHVNDGRSLAMVSDGSVDFVFSYDSLVHAESDVLQVYLTQLARKLKPDGVGFLHHSNLGAFVDARTGQLPFANEHMRAPSMSARLFARYCDEAGLQCISQELVNWGCDHLIDCLSLFTLRGSALARPTKVLENHAFMDEAARLAALSPLYVPRCFDGSHLASLRTAGGQRPSLLRRAVGRVLRVLRGWTGTSRS